MEPDPRWRSVQAGMMMRRFIDRLDMAIGRLEDRIFGRRYRLCVPLWEKLAGWGFGVHRHRARGEWVVSSADGANVV
jgi:hypothetical protein